MLRELLDPRHWKPPEDRRFSLDASQIAELCDQAELIFQEESSVLKLRGSCQPSLELKGLDKHPLFAGPLQAVSLRLV